MSPSSGTGTGTPIGGGVPPGIGSALVQPYPATWLSLFRYARIMGIPPMHFAGATTPQLTPQVFPATTCSAIWTKYDWQNGEQISLMQLAQTIKTVEDELMQACGFALSPTWFPEENHPYPRPFTRMYSGDGRDVMGRGKSLSTKFGKIISGGRRAVTLVGTASVAGGTLSYTDEDSDGYFETATITLATTLTDIREIKVYHSGYDGDMEWEIRPVRSKVLSGGSVIIVIDSWELIDPELYEAYPTDNGFTAIDISDTTNFVTAVDVYREYNDTSQASSQFLWVEDLSSSLCCSDATCENCATVTQDGCLDVRMQEAGVVVPFPATYSSGSWGSSSWTECREPDSVNFWYYAGEIDNLYVQNRTYDPLSYQWAQVIAYMVTARLQKPMCSCTNASRLSEDLRTDLIHSTRDGGTYYATNDVLTSPFGTMKGEVMAWRVIKSLTTRRLKVAVI